MRYAVPGVYVEEVATGPRPIMAVGTSTAGFLGCAPQADRRRHEPVLITNWSQFLREFSAPGAKSTPLSHAVHGFFLNGGSTCFVVNVGNATSIAGREEPREGLCALEAIDEVAIVAAPGFTDFASYKALLDHCEKLGDRFAILDPPAQLRSLRSLTIAGSSGGGEEAKEEGAKAGAKKGAASRGMRPEFTPSGYGALYYPRIRVRDPLDPAGAEELVAPSGHLAGVYARCDAERGVHKAPANVGIRGALGLERRVTRGEQALLNPKGVNVIRFFPDAGILIWGARTIAEESSEYRYVPVRRTMNMIKESIEQGTRWVVFEPNDETLWRSIRRDVSSFLRYLWRSGALMGASEGEAFFVKCDAETNPPEVINRGQVITEVGVSIVKPAEFIVFRIGQSVGEPDQEEAESEGDE
ncbi:MAG: phage tail sheath subtilisin-like domain-containing protein [Myxococcota bacterium]|nr:phage tail sheath subtilisin-like domain-containing protein [Myxococcota bacterium]